MAKLLMNDGTVRNVGYNEAAKILEVLTGIKKPENKKQRDLVDMVKDVGFGDKTAHTHAGKRSFAIGDHDKEMDKILTNTKLVGIEKARAVSNRIRERLN